MLSRTSPLVFPWSAAAPQGSVIEVAPGLFWACLALPFRLNHVNVWLLREEVGWTVVDTGCATPEMFGVWEALFEGPMRELPVRRVVATHGHVDHIGLAGWMVERFDAEFVSTFAEWIWARVSHMRSVPGADATHQAFLIGHGFDELSAATMVADRNRFIDLSTPLPGSITEIRDGDMITMGQRDWRVIVTGGHTFQHASFHDAALGVLIAGDHLLPRISPVIAVYEMVPDADPLADYLASFARFADMPADTMVLPSHGLPYQGLHERIDQLRLHHAKRLEATAAFLSTPKTARELTTLLFPHLESANDIGFALGETLAHVNYLRHTGVVSRRLDEQGRHLLEAKRSATLRPRPRS